MKIALVASLAEGGGGGGGGGSSFRSPFPGSTPGKVPLHPIPHLHLPTASVWVPISIAVALLLLIVGAVVAYLVIRLRFSFFECVLDRHDQVAVGWKKYKAQAWRYFVASFWIGLAFLAVVAGLLIALFLHYKPLLAPLFADHGESNPSIDFGTILSAFALFFLVIMLLALLGLVVETTLNQFILPRFALEDASFRDACTEVWDDFRAEPGQFALFMLMRVLVPLAASIVALMVLLIPMVVLIVIGAVVALVAQAFTHSMTALIPLAWTGIHFSAALIFMVSISFSGTLGTWLRNYGILFYAGRYPALRVRLWPPVEGSMPAVSQPPAPS